MITTTEGSLLTRDEDSSVHGSLRRRRFTLVHNPIDFVQQVLAVRARAPRRGHLVLVPHGVRTDFAVCARLAAALLGTHMATVEEYLAKGRSCGCQFLPTYNNKPKPKLTVSVSLAIAEEFPTVPMLLLKIAQVAGSRIEFARSPRVVEKKSKKPPRVTLHLVLAAFWRHSRSATKCRKNTSSHMQMGMISCAYCKQLHQTPWRAQALAEKLGQ